MTTTAERTHGSRRSRASAWAVTAALVASTVGVLAPSPASAAAGVAPPTLRVDARTIVFGSVLVGSTSVPETVTLRNAGPGTATGLVIPAPTLPEFTRSATTCGTSLDAGATCTVSYTYTPSPGDPANAVPAPSAPETARVGVRADGGGGVTLRLTGAPDTEAFPLLVTGTSIDFGPVKVGTTSATRSVRITNDDDTAHAVSTTGTLSGPFTGATSTCPAPPSSLAPGASCTVGYRFHPTSATGSSRSLVLSVQVSGGPSRLFPVDLMGHGGSVGAPILQITPRRLDFGTVPVGTAAMPQVVTITNTSGRSLGRVATNAGLPGDLAITSTCGTTLAAGASCTATYAPTPAAPGLRSLPIGFGYSSFGIPTTNFTAEATVHGAGPAGRLFVDRSEVQLDAGPGGTPGPAVTIDIRNTGDGPLTDLGVAPGKVPRPAFSVTSDCGTELAAGGSCTASFRYTGTSGGPDAAGYRVTSTGQLANLTAFGGGRTVHEAFVAAAQYQLTADLSPFPADTAARLDAGTLSRLDVVASGVRSRGWAEQLVDVLYMRAIGKHGDAAGVAYWTNQLLSGGRTVSEVAGEILGSNASYVKAGSTDAGWLDRMFAALLNRRVDPSGLAYWSGQIRTRGRASVARRLFDSPEGRRVRVSRLYLLLLLRQPDPSGLTYWSGRILREGDIALAVQLGASAEYLRVAQDFKGFAP